MNGGESVSSDTFQSDQTDGDEKNNQVVENSWLAESDMVNVPTYQAYRESNPCIEKEHCLLCRRERPQYEDGVYSTESGITESSPENELNSSTVPQTSLWVCPECKRTVEEEQQKAFEPLVDYVPVGRELPCFSSDAEGLDNGVNGDTSLCHCEACCERRALEVEQAREQQELRNCWLELKQAVHQMYKDAGLILGETLASQQLLATAPSTKPPAVDHLKELVHRLCKIDPHKLLQCLETQVQLFIVEMRLRLLRQLVAGNSASQPNKSFVHILLEEYAKLCSASKQLSPILQELETMHLKRFNVTWELVNRHLFQSFIYSDPVLHSGLPDVYSSRLGSASHDCQNDTNSAIMKFSDEMTVISIVWREAEQLIVEFSQEQATARVKQMAQRLNTPWKVIEEDIFKSSPLTHRCPCDECCSHHLSSSHLTSHLLTPAELASMAERAESSSQSALPMATSCGNHSSQECGSHKKPTSNTICSLPSSYAASCRECSHTANTVVNDKSHHKMLPNQLVDIPPLPQGICHGANDTSSKFCNKGHSPHKCVNQGGEQTLNSHHHCCHGSFGNIKGSIHHCESHRSNHFCQNHSTSYPLSLSNGLVTSVPPPPPSSSSSSSSSSTSSSSSPNSLEDGSYDERSLQSNGDREKIESSESSPAPLQGTSGLTEEKPCECHACIQLKDHLTLPNGPLFPPLTSPTPLRNSIPLRKNIPFFPPLDEVPQSTVTQPLIHPHLYNLHMGKNTAVNNLPLSKPVHHLPWSINLDLEAQEVLQLQIYLATCGEWDYNIDDVRSLLTHQKYTETLGNSMYMNPHMHVVPSVTGTGSVTPGRGRKIQSCGAQSVGNSSPCTDVEVSNDHLLSMSHSLVKGYSPPSVITSTCNSNSFNHSPIKSIKNKRHRHASDSLCVSQEQTLNVDIYNLNKAAIVPPVPGKPPSPTKTVEQQTAVHNMHNSTSIMTTHPPSEAAPLHNRLNQIDHSVQSGCCDEQEGDSNLLEGEESVDDSCSEQSSSTSTSNQRESRVCDCCYCEVFGHGVPAVAPVSKNYPEMRERLRLRLSKRKAEGTATSKTQDKPQDKVDNRALEELVKYIIGTDNSCDAKTTVSKSAKPKKKKKKVEEKKIENESCKNIIQNREELKLQSLQTVLKDKNSSAKPEHLPKEISTQVFQQPHIVENKKIGSSGNSKVVNSRERSKTSSPIKAAEQHISNGSKINGSTNDCENIKKGAKISNSTVVKQNSSLQNGRNSTCSSTLTADQLCSKSGIKSNNSAPITKPRPGEIVNSKCDIIPKKYSQLNKSDSHLNQAIPSHQKDCCISQNKSPNSQKDHPRCSHESEAASTELRGPISPSNKDKAKVSTHIVEGTKGVDGTSQSLKMPTRPKKNKKKKNSLDDNTSPDDVFMPKDIDLENGEMDELERELEAFKRFCFNSVPLAQKEKVHVNLKDIISRKKSSFGSGVTFNSTSSQKC